ncbi:hypothetical protein OPV22_025890 [Ensete ventricosum]|uniref:Uncharacterized protein n=1 Tax=Ensete ventricosum TaxID=4639 RepID=A0AAV8Q949_ENSVE|nr:hypothetical protein OPV22_025890 [Ensete ventricosum]
MGNPSPTAGTCARDFSDGAAGGAAAVVSVTANVARKVPSRSTSHGTVQPLCKDVICTTYNGKIKTKETLPALKETLTPLRSRSCDGGTVGKFEFGFRSMAADSSTDSSLLFVLRSSPRSCCRASVGLSYYRSFD